MTTHIDTLTIGTGTDTDCEEVESKEKVKEHRYPVMEIFGPTLQGEGTLSGAPTHFVRLGGCGFRCTWCDTMYAVDPKQVRDNAARLTTREVLAAVESLGWAPWVTISGGDPAIHKGIDEWITSWNFSGIRVAVETQGQLFPDWLSGVDQLTISPKPPSAGNTTDIDRLYEWLKTRPCTGRVCIKVVIFTDDDIRYALECYQRLTPGSAPPLYDQFWFTTGTAPIYQNLTDPGMRRLMIALSYRQVTDAFLHLMRQGVVFNDRVHVGCQLHALLWPEVDRGK